MFRIWNDASFAEKVLSVEETVMPPLAEKPVRSEALSRLAVLQRETRLVEFL